MLGMHRRTFLLSAAAPFVAARGAGAQDEGWRTFEVTTRVDIQGASGLTRAWLPLAHAPSDRYQRVIKQSWRGSANTLRAIRDEKTGTGVLFAEWPDAAGSRDIELTLQVATRERSVDWRDRTVRGTPAMPLHRYRQSTLATPLDGTAREIARSITKAEADDVAKARAIYEWVVDDKRLGDPGVSFVRLARASGVAARLLCGIRVQAGDVTAAQLARAEFHSARHGWVPVNPAAVRSEYDRRRYFGSWDGSWVAFNESHDLKLPNSSGPALPFLMYPHAEVGGKRLDSRDPAAFRYGITARDIT
jgi:transglutaminase-like putative cysteine protease